MDTISSKRSALFFLPLILSLLMGVRLSRAATTVIAWGSDEIGQTDVPVGITNASAIAAGYYHNLVLTTDGRVIAWGLNTDGQTNVPTGLQHVRMVSAGADQSLALTTDGLMVGWGTVVIATPSSSKVSAVAAGAYSNLGLTSDGSVFSWANFGGSISVVSNLTNVSAIASGDDHNLALTSRGMVVAWGTRPPGETTPPADLQDVIAVAAGGHHSLALRADGSVVAWGNNDYGQTNVPSNLSNVVAIAAGYNVSLALKSDGSVVMWGRDGQGNTIPPPPSSNVVAVAAGVDHGLALLGDGTPFAAGLPLKRTVDSGKRVVLNARVVGAFPLQYQWLFNGVPLAGATDSILILPPVNVSEKGTYSVIASNSRGSTTVTNTLLQVPETAPFITLQPSNHVSLVGREVIFQTRFGGSEPIQYQWYLNYDEVPGGINPVLRLGSGTYGQAGQYSVLAQNAFGQTSSSNATLWVLPVAAWGTIGHSPAEFPLISTNFIMIAAGGNHNLALKPDRTVVAWGGNDFGQSSVPTDLSNVTTIAAGFYHSLAARTDGTVVAWGRNDSGQTNVPGNLSGVVAVSGGLSHSLALRNDGTVVAWGENGNGQTNVPPGLTNVVAIAAGFNHNLALTKKGKVIAWGTGAYGATNVPLDLAEVVAIAAASDYSLALLADGTTYGWGNGTVGPLSVPPGSAPLVAISTGTQHALGLTSDGTVLAWGANWSGQTSVPPGLSNVVAIAAGDVHSMALLGNGAPVPTGQISQRIAETGTRVILNAGVAGAAPLNYQWLFNGTNLIGATNALLTLTNVQMTQHGTYTVVASNLFATTTQEFSLALVQTPPVIVLQPVDQTTYPGSTITFQVMVEGSEPFRFQWFHDGKAIANATHAKLTLSSLSFDAAGHYWAVVRNAFGTITSSMAVLTIPELVAWGEYTDFYPQGPYSEAFAPSDLSNVVEIAAGAYHGLALKSDGNVAAWGNDGYSSGANHVPSGLTNAVQIAAGTYHNLVLKSDGTAFSWGNDDYGRVSLPPALSNFVAVAAGENHDLGLLADGTVVSWGDLSEVPPEVSNIVAIAAGTFHSLALREDGTVIAWGWDPSGETDVPAGLSNIVAIGAAGFHSLALRSDGTALSWGDTSSWPYVFQEDVTNLVAIAAGPFGDYGLRADGKPFPLESFNGNAPCVSFICPDGLNRVLDFAAGSDQVVYQVGKGQLLRTTDLHMGRLHWVSTGNVPWFTQTNVTHDGGDAFQSGAVSNGQESRLKTRVYGPGTISFWWKVSSSQERDTLRFDMSGVQLAGISGTVNWQQRAFAIPPGIRSVEWIFTKDNRITFGKGAGWVDRIRFTPRGSIPPMISRQPSDLSVWRGTMASFGVVAGGVESLRYQWQFNGVNLPGATKDVLTISNVQAGDAGLYRVRVSNAYGTVVSSNVSLTMLDGPPQILVQPTDQISNPGRSAVFQVVTAGTAPQTFQWSLGHDEIPGATNALLSLERLTYSQAGPYSVRIRNQNGTLISSSAHLFIVSVLAWGNNDSGQTNFVIELTNAVAVAGGDSHSLALRADGTVTAWGDNTFGQTDVPATLSNVVAIAAGRAHSLALKSDGTLMAWGANNGQQLIVPPGLSNVVGIAAKSDHNIAVTRSGEVFTWGDNFLQLPVPADLNNVIAVATAIDHSVALKIDGTVLAWGYGDLGATNPPVDLSNVVAIASGGRHSLALRADGRVFAWGYWFYGQDNVPDSLTNAVAISAGDDHSLALHADGTVIGWGRNDFGEVTIPAGLTNVMAISAGNSHTLAVIGENSVPSGPGFEPIVLRAALVNNQVSLLFPTAIGKVYSVESKSSLGDSNWTALTMILGDGAVKMVTDGEATHAQRFYRLRAQ